MDADGRVRRRVLPGAFSGQVARMTDEELAAAIADQRTHPVLRDQCERERDDRAAVRAAKAGGEGPTS